MKQFFWQVRVYYEDTDAGGVVYHANYLSFFERARTEMLREFGFEQDELRDQHQILFAVRSANIDYLKPAKFNDLLIVDTSINAFRKTSLTFTQTLSCRDILLSQAEIRIACIDATQLKPKPIPSFILEKLT